MISLGTQPELYPVWTLAQQGILHIGRSCMSMHTRLIGGLWVKRQHWYSLLNSLSKYHGSPQDPPLVNGRYWSNHPTTLSVLDDQCVGKQQARKVTYSLYCENLPSVSAAQGIERRYYNSQSRDDVELGLLWWLKWWNKEPCLLC